jgi:hypothetical protein
VDGGIVTPNRSLSHALVRRPPGTCSYTICRETNSGTTDQKWPGSSNTLSVGRGIVRPRAHSNPRAAQHCHDPLCSRDPLDGTGSGASRWKEFALTHGPKTRDCKGPGQGWDESVGWEWDWWKGAFTVA